MTCVVEYVRLNLARDSYFGNKVNTVYITLIKKYTLEDLANADTEFINVTTWNTYLYR